MKRPAHRNRACRGALRRIGAFPFAVALLACGASPPRRAPAPVRSEPPAPTPAAAPARPHRVALSAIAPEPAPTRGAITAAGVFVCRQTWTVSPPLVSELPHCLADGYGLTARLLHLVRPDGSEQRYLEAPLAIREVRDCGNREREVRRPPASLVRALAPDLADAGPASEADLTGATFTSCAAPDVILEIPHDAELVHAGALLRVRAPTGGAVRLLAREREVARWSLEVGACPPTLALEVLCAGDRTVVGGGPLACEGGAAITTENLPCVPDANGIGPAFARFERFLVLGDGTIVPLAITPPRWRPSTR